MAKYTIEDTTLTAIADAVRSKTGNTELIPVTSLAAEIERIETGGGGGGSTGGDEWIGDGNTHIWISLPEGRTSPMMGLGVKGTVTVDWGDGTAPDVLTGTSVWTIKWTPNHEYAKAGDYVITLTADNEIGFYGDGTRLSAVLTHSSSKDARNYVYLNSVRRVEISNNLKSIYGNAFNGCYSLTSVNISDGVTQISSSAFKDCYKLTSVTIPDSVTIIGGNAFLNCYNLTSVTIPDGVTQISGSAFQDCYNLTSVTIPDSVTIIEGKAFYNCYKLTSVTIPDGVTSIGGSAFLNCLKLTSITIPSSVTSIAGNAFDGCSNVFFYDFTNHTAVPTLSGTKAFNGIFSDCEIRVPAALYDEWIAATNWTTYASNIVAV